MWYENAAFYHIYPLGFLGCESVNDFKSEAKNRILYVLDVIAHIKTLANAVYFGPVFESSSHGYDTADYLTIDRRIGTNADFAKVCDALHKNGIKIIVDGVFNHVGRDFWAFKDVRENKWNSRYKDWFVIRDGNSPYNDGFFYEGWEGHYELVKLNQYNPEVKEYIKSCITAWREQFGIDGIRFDVAYCLDLNFLKELRAHCKALSADFWLMGETLHGDYKRWMNTEMLDSVTNYECYKGIYSSFNELNMFEIAHSLNRQFGREQWCLYTGRHLYCFADNHDVTRIATILKYKEHLPLVYTLVYTMPGIPSVYYGGEYGAEGDKKNGDAVLRPKFELCDDGALTGHISKLALFHTKNSALGNGSYRQLQLTNRQLAFARELEDDCVITLINADGAPFTFSLNYGADFTDILSGQAYNLGQPVSVAAYSSLVLKKENS